ncbi:small acid-soluble spore protein H [Oceanobacillus saliphilus]|uniref:small acid-soluble spore protein H n=1 Tax=Oceanobacillus saliphilus TaxID=2925834 RepID=UPI00201D4522|nr:small acid-soluble spore protein H [Oceanobacillus saliphilus]
MNIQRAEEIVESPELVNVTYNGKMIYIQHVDENNQIARIYPLDDPQNEFDVQLDQLHEE